MRFILLILFTACTTVALAQADRKFIRKGNIEFDQDQFQRAEIEYRKALEKEPGSFRADYNLGNALYKQKQFEAAATKYGNLVEKDNKPADLNRFYYNLGNAFFENKKYKESIEAYKNALRNDPGDMDAKHNLQLALRMLNEMNQQQNRNSQSDNKDQQNDKKDQQNMDQQSKDQQKEGNDNVPRPENQPQGAKGRISREDAERILQALENEEKNVMKKIQDQKEHQQKSPLDKNW